VLLFLFKTPEQVALVSIKHNLQPHMCNDLTYVDISNLFFDMSAREIKQAVEKKIIKKEIRNKFIFQPSESTTC
jgi:hypothetical protein